MKSEKNKDTNSGRRHLLQTFGLTALAVSGGSALSAPKAKVPEIKKVYNVYGTVDEMKRDLTLKDGTIVRTAGYYAIGDGGDAEFIIKSAKNEEEGTVPVSNNLFASLINVKTVNYKMFGTLCDGKSDDGVQIKLAHAYANRMNIPVINRSGEFWFKGTTSITVMTSIEWGNTVFHYDEKASGRANLFIVLSREKNIPIEFDAATKAKFLAQIKPGVKQIPELAPYKNYFVIVTDTNDKIGSRSGARYNGTATKPKEEFFYVEEHGRIIGDIAWEFKDYTGIVAYPGNDSYLIIDGGTFYMSGDTPLSTGYVNIGFSIRRCRTVVRNQWVGLEKGVTDISMSPKNGFYSFSSVYDILLENVRLIPWEKDRPGTDKDVRDGTYGIGGNRVLNGTFRNVTAEGSPIHWGVFGTNLYKNFRVEQCYLNRIDVHFHAWNLYIKDSKVGSNGITLTGGGDLFVENTTCMGSSFIAFRNDFGAKWDGDIRIRNCRHMPITMGETAILSFVAENFDYKYPLGYGRTLKVEDMIVDFNTVPTSKSASWLMRTSPFSKVTDGGARLFFPSHLEFKNVTVEGREQGMRLLKIPDPQYYKLPKAGGYDGIKMVSNCKMIFQDIQTEKMVEQEPQSEMVHLIMKNASKAAYMDAYALYPEIRMERCKDISAHFGGNAAEVIFDQCSISRITGADNNTMPGALTFTNCKFEPLVKNNDKPFYMVGTELGTSFMNCIVYAPIVDGVSRPELIDKIGFIQVNKAVYYNHVNTRLGNDILNYLKGKGVKISAGFIGMLKTHHEMEQTV